LRASRGKAGARRSRADIPVRNRTAADAGRRTARLPYSAEFRHFFRLARLVLMVGHQGYYSSGRDKMAKFEALAFTVGFVMTGFLALVALPFA
jgi:hypothetical protein